jgi:molybdate transport system substrate-binding protein
MKLRILTRVLGGGCLLVLWSLGVAADAAAGVPAPGKTTLVVFAAASLVDALEEVHKSFSSQTGYEIKASYAASSVLAKQIEAGAHADVFFSADREWVDYLDKRGLLRPGTRRDVLGNSLVLIAPADSSVRLKIAPGFALATALGGGRLAMADPESVPAGLYGKEALSKLGVWEQVKAHLAPAENVRAALAYVARGETPLGIVYQTDAQAERHVRLVDVFPEDTHAPIVYPAAVMVSAQPQAEKYVDFLGSEGARQVFVRAGFKPLR